MNTSETEQAQKSKMLICVHVLVLLLASWSSFRVKQTRILILVCILGLVLVLLVKPQSIRKKETETLLLRPPKGHEDLFRHINEAFRKKYQFCFGIWSNGCSSNKVVMVMAHGHKAWFH